ncbi:putative myosin ATPase [Helianthus anomalus]
MFPKSTHETFANKLFQNLRAHSRLGKAEFSETDFAISHYAGKVSYQTDSFLDKNRDYVVVDHCNLMSSSKCSFIAGLFPALAEESSRSSYKFSSVASRFKVWLFIEDTKFFRHSFVIFFFCFFMVIATTTSPYGYPQLNRASLRPLCKAKLS